MAFTGHLLYMQDIGSNPVTYTEIPMDKIRYETYSITPNQRMDLDTGLRDLTGVMHRNVVSHTATKIEFETVLMKNSELDVLMKSIRDHWLVWLERDVNLRYYDPENDVYKSGHFYMPDIQFVMRNVDSTNSKINYTQVRFAFIEY